LLSEERCLMVKIFPCAALFLLPFWEDWCYRGYLFCLYWGCAWPKNKQTRHTNAA